MKNRQALNSLGFTLLEVMIVVALVALLAIMAVPSQIGRVTQQRIIESVELVERYKKDIEKYYFSHGGRFPDDNADAGLPEPRKIIGNYIERVEVRAGVLHLFLGQKMSKNLHNKVISIRPVYVENSVDSPISWVCGYAKVPVGMVAAGRNLSDIERLYLPGRCRI